VWCRHDRMAYLDDTVKSGKVLVIDFIVTQQLRVIAKISKELSELPTGLSECSTTARKGGLLERLRLDCGKTDEVKRISSVPAILPVLHANVTMPILSATS
jgi:hypothetical protein